MANAQIRLNETKYNIDRNERKSNKLLLLLFYCKVNLRVGDARREGKEKAESMLPFKGEEKFAIISREQYENR